MSADDFDEDEDFNPEQWLAEAGLLGDVLSIHCMQEPDDFLSVRRIGDTEHAAEGMEPVVSLVTHVEQAHAQDGFVMTSVMLSAEGARVLAAHLMNAADEIDGFKAMFDIGSKVEEE